jgi:DnaJ-domain-containing protein 1
LPLHLPIGYLMDPAHYYYTTMMTAFTKLAPYFIFIVGGYFIFIKMPFLFLKKSMDDQKKNLEPEKKDAVPKLEKPVEKPRDRLERKEEQRKEGPKKEQPKKEAPPKRPQPAAAQKTLSPEEVLGFRPGEAFTQSELKKRYFDLLKQNHPDRVAMMGADFKKLADKNTKDINQAYEKLKNKAA